MREPTNYIESNALLAVQCGDEAHARDLLREMLPNELRELIKACDRLGWMSRTRLAWAAQVPIEEQPGGKP